MRRLGCIFHAAAVWGGTWKPWGGCVRDMDCLNNSARCRQWSLLFRRLLPGDGRSVGDLPEDWIQCGLEMEGLTKHIKQRSLLTGSGAAQKDANAHSSHDAWGEWRMHVLPRIHFPVYVQYLSKAKITEWNFIQRERHDCKWHTVYRSLWPERWTDNILYVTCKTPIYNCEIQSINSAALCGLFPLCGTHRKMSPWNASRIFPQTLQ